MHFRIGSDSSEILVVFDLDFPTVRAVHPLFPFCSSVSFFSPFSMFFGPSVTPVKVKGEALE